MKKLAFVSLIYGITSWFVRLIGEVYITPMLSKSGDDLFFVFVAVLLLFVSYIFQYGELLQQQDDETLQEESVCRLYYA